MSAEGGTVKVIGTGPAVAQCVPMVMVRSWASEGIMGIEDKIIQIKIQSWIYKEEEHAHVHVHVQKVLWAGYLHVERKLVQLETREELTLDALDELQIAARDCHLVGLGFSFGLGFGLGLA